MEQARLAVANIKVNVGTPLIQLTAIRQYTTSPAAL